MEIKKTITDKVFGTLNFTYTWSREMQIDFCGKSVQVELLIRSEMDEPFDEGQYLSYTALMEKWQDLQPKLLPAILDYYNIEPHEDYPSITSGDELAKYIELTCIVVPWARADGKREIGLLFNSPLEKEHGFGILLLNKEIAKVGYQNVAL